MRVSITSINKEITMTIESVENRAVTPIDDSPMEEE